MTHLTAPIPVAYAGSVVKTYGTAENPVTALRGVSAAFARGRLTAVTGPPGSGKSTLLHCLAGLDTVSSGTVVIDGVDLARLSPTRLTRLREDRLGFVFQSFDLPPALTAEENIRLTARLAGRPVDRDRFTALVGALGLRDRLGHRAAELSGGQRRRVAVARALLPRPDVVFADEPTGGLDSSEGAEVLRVLRAAADTHGQTVVMATRDPAVAAHADRVLFLAGGRIVGERPSR